MSPVLLSLEFPIIFIQALLEDFLWFLWKPCRFTLFDAAICFIFVLQHDLLLIDLNFIDCWYLFELEYSFKLKDFTLGNIDVGSIHTNVYQLDLDVYYET